MLRKSNHLGKGMAMHAKYSQDAMGVIDLDNRLIKAVFEPARETGVFDGSTLPWESSCTADNFIALLLPLSEHYQESNPTLSAALWGIWNASRSFRLQRPLLAKLFERKRKGASVFVELKGLVATAALQFADGTGSTIITSDCMTNYSEYSKKAETALDNLVRLSTLTRPT